MSNATKIETVTLTEPTKAAGNVLYAGTYRVEMPVDYDPGEVTGEDILCDAALRIKEAVEQDTRSPVRVGNCVYIRTVTHHYTGRIVALTDAEIILREAAWIADQGVMSTAIASGKLDEVEPYPDDVGVTVHRGAMVDACDWTHDLPRQQK